MFAHYVAFGDSISIDEYAGPGLGAASLLHRNRSDFWPEFDGLDLVTRHPHCGYTRLAFDGATLMGAWKQLARAPKVDGRVLVTVTIGGNDVLAGMGQPDNAYRTRYPGRDYLDGEGDVTLTEWLASLHKWLDAVGELYPNCLLIMGNVYDPSDGTGRLQSGGNLAHLLPMLHTVNDSLRQVAHQRGHRFADIHAHFLGQAQDWIYREIEPTQRGSSEIRRLFWQASQ